MIRKYTDEDISYEKTLKNYSYLFTSTLDKIVAIIDNLDNNKTDDN